MPSHYGIGKHENWRLNERAKFTEAEKGDIILNKALKKPSGLNNELNNAEQLKILKKKKDALKAELLKFGSSFTKKQVKALEKRTQDIDALINKLSGSSPNG